MKPVLLLLAGMLNDARMWAPVGDALHDVADVRVADLRSAPSIAAMAHAAWQCIADVDAQRPVVLAGFSMGGYVAMEMLANPRRGLHAAALLSTSARPETAEGRVAREKAIGAMRADFPKMVDGLVQWGMHQPGPAVAEQLRQMCLEIGAETGIRQNRAIMDRADHRAALAQLRLPVHLLCGQKDRITPPALTEELLALVPASTVHWIADAGHMLPLEQPGAVAQVLRSLLPPARS